MKFLKISTWSAWGIAVLAMGLYALPIPVNVLQMVDPPLNEIVLHTIFYSLPIAVLLLGIRIAVSMNVFPRILYIVGSVMIVIFMATAFLELSMYDVSPWPIEYSLPILITWISIALGLILAELQSRLVW